jgi:hypothetical protein
MRELITVNPDTPASKVVDLLHKKDIGSVIVTGKNNLLVGIITRRDVRLLTSKELSLKKASDVMTGDRLVTVSEGISKADAIKLMHMHRIEKLLVVNKKGQILDIIAIKDIQRKETDCFVMIPFNEPYLTIFKDHIKKPLENEFKIIAIKADDIFKPEPIIDSVQYQIKKSDILIADITERNPNVYYEVGFAHALEKKIIFTSQNVDSIPFDVAHWRCIKYEFTPRGMTDFEVKLVNAVKSILKEIQSGAVSSA